VWAVENLHEDGRITDDAARGILMALYEDQGLEDVEVPDPDTIQ
jgi:hypothetical protein